MKEEPSAFTNRRVTRRSLLRGVALTSLGLAGISALAGCGTSTPTETKPAAPAPTAAPAAPAAPAKPAAQPTAAAPATPARVVARGKEVKPIRGGTVNGFWSSPGQIDPTITTGTFPSQAWSKVHGGNGLLRPRADFPDDMVFEPAQLASWQTSSDGLTWTLKLRNDVYWHDIPPVNGRKFTSADVGWSIDFWNNNGVYQYLWSMVTKWATPDDTTIVLTLKEPSVLVYAAMTTHYFFVLPREVQEQNKNFGSEKFLIGTGPWMLDVATVEPKTHWLLKRNPKNWEKGVDGQPLPYIDKFDLAVIMDYPTALAALRARKLDLWWQPGGFGIDPQDIPGLKQSNPELVVDTENRPIIYRVDFNCSKPPFNDPRNRIAVSKAIDRQVICDTLWDGNASWDSWVPSSLVGYTLTPERTKQAFARDLEGAKKLFQETGLAAQTINVYTRNASPYNKMLTICSAMLKEAGVNNEIKLVETAAFYALQQSADWELIVYVGVPATQEPSNHVGALFKTGDPRNLSRFSDKKLDDMITAADKEMDEAKRKKAYIDMQEYMLTLMPSAPLVTDLRFKIAPPHLVNYPGTHWTYGFPRMERSWIDDSKRAK